MRTGTPFSKSYREVGLWALLAGSLVALGMLLAPFLHALLWAAVLAVLMYPLYRKCRSRFSGNASASITLLATLLLIIVPIGLIALMIYIQTNHLAAQLTPGSHGPTIDSLVQSLDKLTDPMVKRLGINFDLQTWFAENRYDFARQLRGPASRILVLLGTSVFMLVVSMFSLFFFIRDGDKMREPVIALSPLEPSETQLLLDRLAQTIVGVFMGIVLVSFVQGTLAGIAYWLVGIEIPLAWALATMIICVIPLMGAPAVYVPLSLMLLAQEKYLQGLLLLGIGFGIVSQIDNFLRPIFISRRTALTTLQIFLGLLGGVLLFGPVGIMAGPLLFVFATTMLEIVRERRGMSPEKAP